MRYVAWIAAAVAVAGCGASERGRSGGDRLEQYGISIEVPDGWHGEITRGRVRLATAPPDAEVPPEQELGPGDVSVVLFEYEPPPGEAGSPAETYDGSWPPQFGTRDFADPDTQGEIDAANAPGRRAVSVRGRFFNVFATAGSRHVPQARIEELNEALARIEVEAGEFSPGIALPVEFPARQGWYVVTSGPRPRHPQGEYVQTAAATIPYLNGPNHLPPARTLEALPAGGILLWVALSRDARWSPSAWARNGFVRREPPYRLADLEPIRRWEGQVRDIPEYRLWAANGDQYVVDLRVYFGRAHPTDEMLAEADAVLRALRFPDWGPWELDGGG